MSVSLFVVVFGVVFVVFGVVFAVVVLLSEVGFEEGRM